MRKSLLIHILAVLIILTSVPAMAGGEITSAKPIANLNFTDKVVYFLDHTSDPEDGNWITLGCPNETTRIQLPEPIRLTYSGPKDKEYGGVSGTLNKEENESYIIKYPSTSSYATHPVYLPDENVTMSFHGEPDLNGNIDIYLFNVTSKCAYSLINALKTGDIGNINKLFENSTNGEYKKYSTTLGNYGDLLEYDLGCLDAGQYCVVMVQQNEDRSMTVLSSTAFVVEEHKLCVSSPSSIVKENNLDINMSLEGASDNNYTYGAVLIKDQAYKADIEINSNGTKAGTSVIVNGVNLIDEFDVNSSNYKSKLTKNELQTEVQTLIGEGKGAIAIGETGQGNLSLTAFDLPVGSYYLLVGAYSPGKGLVGLSQKEVEIKSKGSSKDSKNGGSSSGEGNGGSDSATEPAKNVKIKEICKHFISDGNKIKFEFPKSATPVGYVKFDAKKTAGKITTIVEELKGKSSLTPAEPEGVIYKYLDIRVENGDANSKNVENAAVGFKVSKEWIEENHINMDTVVLQHFDGTQWNSLETKKVDEDDRYINFEAETPSFSPFAITASKNTLEIGEKTGSQVQSTSELGKQESSELTMESAMPSKENGSSLAKVASFFIGFLVIILMGTFIKRKAE